MAKLKDLLDIAKGIKDPKLRKMTENLLKNPGLSHKAMSARYRTASISEAPASMGFHHTRAGGLIEHTLSVTRMCLSVAESLKKSYDRALDLDILTAGALLHDIGKLWSYRKGAGGWEANDNTLEHTVLGSSELYVRGFPEKVIHMVSSSHSEPDGLIPPQTLEALILHTVDNLDATIGKSKEEGIIKLLLG